MAQSYTNLLYHIIFSTKDRRPFLTPTYESHLYDYIGGTICGIGGISLELNGTGDHIHLLAKLRPDKALSDALRELKANASGWMHDIFPEMEEFSWQRGYGAFTVSQSNVEEVRRYIGRQKERHQRIPFRDEFIQFLKPMKFNTMTLFINVRLSPVSRALRLGAEHPGAHAPGFMLTPASLARWSRRKDARCARG